MRPRGPVLPARDALVVAMIGDPGAGFPPVRDLDLSGFWVRFESAAPWHLAAGFRASTVVLAGLAPRVLGHRCGLGGLDADEADRVVQRAAGWPAVGLLAEVAKIVACFAYFSDPRVQAVARGGQ